MKKLVSTLLLVALAGLPLFAADQPAAGSAVTPPATPRPRLSPHETVGAVIDGSRVTITYGRPYSKKQGTTEIRKVWGTLVPYGQLWRLGSDEATLLVTQHPIMLGGAMIPAGVHSLFAWVNEDGSMKLIVNKQVGQWGIPGRGRPMSDVYSESNDVARVDTKKDTMEPGLDQFTIAVEKDPANPTGGLIKLAWENTQYSVPFTVKKS